MSKDLRDIIKALKSHQTDLKKAFIWYKEREETDFGTNVVYNGTEGLITQNDLSSNTWNMGPHSGVVSTDMTVLMDSWGNENRLRMMYPLAEWIRLDNLTRSLGITINPGFQPWEFIAMSFILCYLNGYHMIYPWGNFVQIRPATKPVMTVEAQEKTEHEMTVSAMLKPNNNRAATDRTILCNYPRNRVMPAHTYSISGGYFASSVGKKFSRRWNQYCEQHNKLGWLCDGVIFTNDDGDIVAAGGEHIEDVAVVFEKDRKIISPGINEGNFPGATMVTFFLIGEVNGYTVENRPITMADLKKSDWGVVTELATLTKWDGIIDPERKELVKICKQNEYRFNKVFLQTFIKLKHGDSRLKDLPKIIERGEEWFPESESRHKLSVRGLQMKKQRWDSEGWKNITVTPPEGEITFKRRRTQIANMYGKYWNLPLTSSQHNW